VTESCQVCVLAVGELSRKEYSADREALEKQQLDAQDVNWAQPRRDRKRTGSGRPRARFRRSA
jgi:hypothetical protein